MTLQEFKQRTGLNPTEIAEMLIGKACAYDDTDLYSKAVELVGINRVIELKIKLNLPLWDEDKAYLIKLLNR